MEGSQLMPPVGWKWEGRKTSPLLPFLQPPSSASDSICGPTVIDAMLIAALGP